MPATDLDDYLLEHMSPEHPYLHKLYRATHTHLLRPRMASGPLQGKLLTLLCRMLHPQTVVEIGTYSGYSALAMAAGMPEGSRIVTFEINDEQEDFTRPWLEGSPWREQVDIKMVIGDILQAEEQVPHGIDLAFVDGNKRDYLAYYEFLLPRLSPGGCMLADNTLWDGHVLESDREDAQTQGIRAFNDRVAADDRVETLILPLRDGLTLIRKLS